MTQPTTPGIAARPPVPAPRATTPAEPVSFALPVAPSERTLLAAEVVVIADGPYPGPDAITVAREIAARLDAERGAGQRDDVPGRVAVLVHTPPLRPEDYVPEVRPTIPAHWVGPLLRSWAERSLTWAQGRAELDAVRARVHTAFGLGALRGTGITVAAGTVTLLPKGRVALDTQGAHPATHVLSPQRIVLATGATPTVPDVPGMHETTWYSAASLLERPEPPDSAVVVGAGELGCEVAQALARLGVTVTLVDAARRPLADLPLSAVEPIAAALAEDGVRFIGGARLVKVAPTLDGGAWVGTDRSGDVAAEALVLAGGMTPRTAGLDVAATGSPVRADGSLTLDERMRTASGVFACGEVTGRVAHATSPITMARLVAANVTAKRGGQAWPPDAAIRVVRTDPELVVLGPVSEDLPEGAGSGEDGGPLPAGWARVQVAAAPARGLLGFGAGPGRPLLGAVLLGAGAVDAAGELALALRHQVPAAALVDVDAAEGSWAATVQTAVARALAG